MTYDDIGIKNLPRKGKTIYDGRHNIIVDDNLFMSNDWDIHVCKLKFF
jgi:hypothetical protein